MSRTSIRIAVFVLGLAILLIFFHFGRAVWVPISKKVSGKETVASVIKKYGKSADNRLSEHFERAYLEYPPNKVILLAIKEEMKLELWASNGSDYVWVRDYKIKAASGGPGPKLFEGDEQVPEGFYNVIGLNPNSSYHLSIKLNYPNKFDLENAKKEGRNSPGGNIFIHGKSLSIGCLAMGDSAIEELFTLAYRTGKENINVVITPRDPRKHNIISIYHSRNWVPELYSKITEEFLKHQK
ncbi:L,D-transpeptidase family protein [Kaarinaea lacus]